MRIAVTIRLAFGVSHNGTTLAVFLKASALHAMLTGLADAEACTFLILVLRVNKEALQANRKSSGKGSRAKHLKSGASRSKCGKATVEPVLNRSGSEPSLEWILLWNGNQPEIAKTV